ncbi:MAG: hypothetical protein KAW52_02235 [candidate division Zixibacteria bacterium]|nr:hypothetical protein [candidate division Zixibacteria bacterium]
MPEFHSDKIELIQDEKTKNPVSFVWRDKEYKIKEVIAFWPDYSYSKSGAKRNRWWQRRHRNCYRVLTDEDEVFEIYFDRGSKEEEWILYTKLE